jgi:cobaltochelatase CobS
MTDDTLISLTPDTTADCQALFGFDPGFEVPAFSGRDSHVPDIDDTYVFDPATTRAILAGFATIAASWFRAITAPANPPISNRSPRA